MQEKKVFENLNFEKPSKSFLEIAKALSTNDDVNVIRGDNGEIFDNPVDRNNYITNFYSMLYRKDEGVGGSIEDFLGEEICRHKVVTDSKLTEQERIALEADLTLEELEKSLGESNMRSAPGVDGFSNKFIKKILEGSKDSFFQLLYSVFGRRKLD
jgi:hypothetical protein